MSGAALSDWLAERTPPAPPAFEPWLALADADVSTGPAALVELARAALLRAEEPGARPHAGAFDLLAADAWVTYACESALESDDPRRALDGVLAALLA